MSTGRLASFSARRPWWVVGIWVAFLAGSIIAFPGLSHALTANEMQFLNNPDSVKAEKLLAQGTSGSSARLETLLVHSDKYTVDDAAFRQIVADSTTAVTADTSAVSSAFNYYQASHVRSHVGQRDGLGGPPHHDHSGHARKGDKDLGTYLKTVDSLSRTGFTVTTVGSASIGHDLASTATGDLKKAEMVGFR